MTTLPGRADEPRFGIIHGRFQPFSGYWECVQRVADRCRAIIVGLTNPDPELILEEGTSGHRHLSESNPFTFFERLRMICETLLDCNLSPERVIIIPFPINFHDRWR